MRLTFERDTDSAYLELTDLGEPRVVAKTYTCNPTEVGGMINLDFDPEDRLIGIEIVGATKKLRPTVIRLADSDS